MFAMEFPVNENGICFFKYRSRFGYVYPLIISASLL